MNTKELRKKSEIELREALIKLEKDYRDQVGNILQRKEKNVKKARLVKKDIARVKTIMTEKRFIKNI